MINQLLRLGALIATGRFLKPRLKGLLWIAGVWIVLWFVHSEFVSYVELSGDTSFVLYASLIKTAFYALSIGLYVWLVERRLWPKPVKVPPPSQGPATKPGIPIADSRDKGKGKLPPGTDGDDGFDFLRDKKTLKAPSDRLLNKPDS